MRGRGAVFPDRERFIGYAARVMRGLIIDFVRDRRALKRGGDFHITSCRHRSRIRIGRIGPIAAIGGP